MRFLVLLVLASCAAPDMTRLERDLLECSTKATDYCEDVRRQIRKRDSIKKTRNPCPFGGVPVILRGDQVGCTDLSELQLPR